MKLKFYRELTLIPLTFLSLSLFGQTAPETGIKGIITVGPVQGGPSRIGVSDSRPLANVEFDVKNQSGAITSFATDAQGRFHLSLAPGHYIVSKKHSEGKISHYGPFDVDVVAGQMTKVQWRCDTGLR